MEKKEKRDGEKEKNKRKSVSKTGNTSDTSKSDEEAAYERKFQEMQKYVPFLEIMISKLEMETERQGQLDKMRSLYAILTLKQKLKPSSLEKCDQILEKLYGKVESERGRKVAETATNSEPSASTSGASNSQPSASTSGASNSLLPASTSGASKSQPSASTSGASTSLQPASTSVASNYLPPTSTSLVATNMPQTSSFVDRKQDVGDNKNIKTAIRPKNLDKDKQSGKVPEPLMSHIRSKEKTDANHPILGNENLRKGEAECIVPFLCDHKDDQRDVYRKDYAFLSSSEKSRGKIILKSDRDPRRLKPDSNVHNALVSREGTHERLAEKVHDLTLGDDLLSSSKVTESVSLSQELKNAERHNRGTPVLSDPRIADGKWETSSVSLSHELQNTERRGDRSSHVKPGFMNDDRGSPSIPAFHDPRILDGKRETLFRSTSHELNDDRGSPSIPAILDPRIPDGKREALLRSTSHEVNDDRFSSNFVALNSKHLDIKEKPHLITGDRFINRKQYTNTTITSTADMSLKKPESIHSSIRAKLAEEISTVHKIGTSSGGALRILANKTANINQKRIASLKPGTIIDLMNSETSPNKSKSVVKDKQESIAKRIPHEEQPPLQVLPNEKPTTILLGLSTEELQKIINENVRYLPSPPPDTIQILKSVSNNNIAPSNSVCSTAEEKLTSTVSTLPSTINPHRQSRFEISSSSNVHPTNVINPYFSESHLGHRFESNHPSVSEVYSARTPAHSTQFISPSGEQTGSNEISSTWNMYPSSTYTPLPQESTMQPINSNLNPFYYGNTGGQTLGNSYQRPRAPGYFARAPMPSQNSNQYYPSNVRQNRPNYSESTANHPFENRSSYGSNQYSERDPRRRMAYPEKRLEEEKWNRGVQYTEDKSSSAIHKPPRQFHDGETTTSTRSRDPRFTSTNRRSSSESRQKFSKCSTDVERKPIPDFRERHEPNYAVERKHASDFRGKPLASFTDTEKRNLEKSRRTYRDSYTDNRDSYTDNRDSYTDNRDSYTDNRDSYTDNRDSYTDRNKSGKSRHDYSRSSRRDDSYSSRHYRDYSSERKEDAKKKEISSSPLNSLYSEVKGPITGKGYGIQNFKIPKLKPKGGSYSGENDGKSTGDMYKKRILSSIAENEKKKILGSTAENEKKRILSSTVENEDVRRKERSDDVLIVKEESHSNIDVPIKIELDETETGDEFQSINCKEKSDNEVKGCTNNRGVHKTDTVTSVSLISDDDVVKDKRRSRSSSRFSVRETRSTRSKSRFSTEEIKPTLTNCDTEENRNKIYTLTVVKEEPTVDADFKSDSKESYSSCVINKDQDGKILKTDEEDSTLSKINHEAEVKEIKKEEDETIICSIIKTESEENKTNTSEETTLLAADKIKNEPETIIKLAGNVDSNVIEDTSSKEKENKLLEKENTIGSSELCNILLNKQMVAQELMEVFIRKSLQSGECKKLIDKLGETLNSEKLKKIQKIIESSSEDEGGDINGGAAVNEESKPAGPHDKTENSLDKVNEESLETELGPTSSSSPTLDDQETTSLVCDKITTRNALKKQKTGINNDKSKEIVMKKTIVTKPQKQNLSKVKKKDQTGFPSQDISFDANKRKKPKNELDKLHDDIRDMFISEEVVSATGIRTCRLRNLASLDNSKKSEDANLDTPKTKNKLQNKIKDKKKTTAKEDHQVNESSDESDASTITKEEYKVLRTKRVKSTKSAAKGNVSHIGESSDESDASTNTKEEDNKVGRTKRVKSKKSAAKGNVSQTGEHSEESDSSTNTKDEDNKVGRTKRVKSKKSAAKGTVSQTGEHSEESNSSTNTKEEDNKVGRTKRVKSKKSAAKRNISPTDENSDESDVITNSKEENKKVGKTKRVKSKKSTTKRNVSQIVESSDESDASGNTKEEVNKVGITKRVKSKKSTAKGNVSQTGEHSEESDSSTNTKEEYKVLRTKILKSKKSAVKRNVSQIIESSDESDASTNTKEEDNKVGKIKKEKSIKSTAKGNNSLTDENSEESGVSTNTKEEGNKLRISQIVKRKKTAAKRNISPTDENSDESDVSTNTKEEDKKVGKTKRVKSKKSAAKGNHIGENSDESDVSTNTKEEYKVGRTKRVKSKKSAAKGNVSQEREYSEESDSSTNTKEEDRVGRTKIVKSKKPATKGKISSTDENSEESDVSTNTKEEDNKVGRTKRVKSRKSAAKGNVSQAGEHSEESDSSTNKEEDKVRRTKIVKSKKPASKGKIGSTDKNSDESDVITDTKEENKKVGKTKSKKLATKGIISQIGESSDESDASTNTKGEDNKVESTKSKKSAVKRNVSQTSEHSDESSNTNDEVKENKVGKTNEGKSKTVAAKVDISQANQITKESDSGTDGKEEVTVKMYTECKVEMSSAQESSVAGCAFQNKEGAVMDVVEKSDILVDHLQTLNSVEQHNYMSIIVPEPCHNSLKHIKSNESPLKECVAENVQIPSLDTTFDGDMEHVDFNSKGQLKEQAKNKEKLPLNSSSIEKELIKASTVYTSNVLSETKGRLGLLKDTTIVEENTENIGYAGGNVQSDFKDIGTVENLKTVENIDTSKQQCQNEATVKRNLNENLKSEIDQILNNCQNKSDAVIMKGANLGIGENVVNEVSPENEKCTEKNVERPVDIVKLKTVISAVADSKNTSTIETSLQDDIIAAVEEHGSGVENQVLQALDVFQDKTVSVEIKGANVDDICVKESVVDHTCKNELNKDHTIDLKAGTKNQKLKKNEKRSHGELRDCESVSNASTIKCTPLTNIFTDKTYYQSTEVKLHACKLCKYSGKTIVKHYVFDHPDHNVLASRLSETAAEEAILRSNSNIDEDNKSCSIYRCYMCIRVCTNIYSFYDHITLHTGEYRHQCQICKFRAPNRDAIKLHISSHPESKHKDGYKKCVSTNSVTDLKHVYGYICSECYFFQLNPLTVQDHVKIIHTESSNKPKAIKINMNLSVKANERHDDVYSEENVTEANERNVEIVGPGETQVTIKIEPRDDENEIDDVENCADNIMKTIKKESCLNAFIPSVSDHEYMKIHKDTLLFKMNETMKLIGEHPRKRTGITAYFRIRSGPYWQYINRNRDDSDIADDTSQISDDDDESGGSQNSADDELTTSSDESPLDHLPTFAIKERCSSQSSSDLESDDEPTFAIKERCSSQSSSDLESDDEQVFFNDNHLCNLPPSIDDDGSQSLSNDIQLCNSPPSIDDDVSQCLSDEEDEFYRKMNFAIMKVYRNTKLPPKEETEEQQADLYWPDKTNPLGYLLDKLETPPENATELDDIQASVNNGLQQIGLLGAHTRRLEHVKHVTVGPIMVSRTHNFTFTCTAAACQHISTNPKYFVGHFASHDDADVEFNNICSACDSTFHLTYTLDRVGTLKGYIKHALEHLVSIHHRLAQAQSAQAETRDETRDNDEPPAQPPPRAMLRVRRLSGDKLSTLPSNEGPGNAESARVNTEDSCGHLRIESVISVADCETLDPETLETLNSLHNYSKPFLTNKFQKVSPSPKSGIYLKSAMTNSSLSTPFGSNVGMSVCSQNVPSDTAASIARKLLPRIEDENFLKRLKIVHVTKTASILPPVSKIVPVCDRFWDQDIPPSVEEEGFVKQFDVFTTMLIPDNLIRLFKCMATTCSFTSDKADQFMLHCLSHENNEDENIGCKKCAYCVTSCDNIVDLCAHILHMHSRSLYQCAFCFYRAFSAGNVFLHQNLTHTSEKITILKCKSAFGPNDIQLPPPPPVMPERGSVVLPYVCEQGKCHKRTYSPKAFEAHVKSHGHDAFLCNVCNGIFSVKDGICEHFKSHCINIYQCPFCVHGADNTEDMRSHLCRLHPDMSPQAILREGNATIDLRKQNLAFGIPLDCLTECNLDDQIVPPGCVMSPPEIEIATNDIDPSNFMQTDVQQLLDETTGLLLFPHNADSLLTETTGLLLPESTRVQLTPSPPDLPDFYNIDEDIMEKDNNFKGKQPSLLKRPNTSTDNMRKLLLKDRFAKNQLPQDKSNKLWMVLSNKPHQNSGNRMAVATPVEQEVIDLCSSSQEISDDDTSVVASKRMKIALPFSSSHYSFEDQNNVCVASGAKQVNAKSVAPEMVDLSSLSAPYRFDEEIVASERLEDDFNMYFSQEDVNPNAVRILKEIGAETDTPEIITVDSSCQSSSENRTSSVVANNKLYDDDNEPMNLGSSQENLTDLQSNLNDFIDMCASQQNLTDLPSSLHDMGHVHPQSPTNVNETLPPNLRTIIDSNTSQAMSCRSSIEECSEEECYDLETNEGIFSCGFKLCRLSFAHPLLLLDHITRDCTYRRVSKLICKHCKEEFKSINSFIEHLKIHKKLRFLCSICKLRKPTKLSIIDHMKEIHQVTDIKINPVDPLLSDLEKDSFIVAGEQKDAASVSGGAEPSGETSSSNTSFSMADIDRLPNKSIFDQMMSCQHCNFTTKVVKNMQLHLKCHISGEDVPNKMVVNPVPCLEKNEKMFDKMINLAGSSHLKPSKKPDYVIDPKDLPQFVSENERYECHASGCTYLTVDDVMLRHHIKALHSDETYYRCPHCTIPDGIEVPVEKLGNHLKLHDNRLYKCVHCAYHHNQRHFVERHLNERHPEKKPFVHVVREPDNDDNPDDAPDEPNASTNQISSKLWKCNQCKAVRPKEYSIKKHCGMIHGISHRFKCSICDYKTDIMHYIFKHFTTQHPGEPVKTVSIYEKIETTDKHKSMLFNDSGPSTSKLTNPLWQRDVGRVKHIRGILLDENPQRQKQATVVQEMLEESGSLGPYGQPAVGNYYLCPRCSKYKTKNKIDMMNHLFREVDYKLWFCGYCKKSDVSKHFISRHIVKVHENRKELIEMATPNDDVEEWVNRVILRQQYLMKMKDNNVNLDTCTASSATDSEQIPIEEDEARKKIISRRRSSSNFEAFESSFEEFLQTNAQIPKPTILKPKRVSEKKWRCGYCSVTTVLNKNMVNHLRKKHPMFIPKMVQIVRNERAKIIEQEHSAPAPAPVENDISITSDIFECSLCGLLGRVKQLADHHKLAHPNSVFKVARLECDKFCCAYCDHIVLSIDQIEFHYQHRHPNHLLNYKTIRTESLKETSVDVKKNDSECSPSPSTVKPAQMDIGISFHCPICFTSIGQTEMLIHLQSHMQYVCTVCEKVFSDTVTCKRHIQDMHKFEDGHTLATLPHQLSTPETSIAQQLSTPPQTSVGHQLSAPLKTCITLATASPPAPKPCAIKQTARKSTSCFKRSVAPTKISNRPYVGETSGIRTSMIIGNQELNLNLSQLEKMIDIKPTVRLKDIKYTERDT